MSPLGQSISFFRRQIWVQRCITPPSFIRIRREWDIYGDVKHDKRAFGVICCALPMWEQRESKSHLWPNGINHYQLILDHIRVSYVEDLKTVIPAFVCMTGVREAEITLKKTPVTPKVLRQHSEFWGKIFNSCVELAPGLPGTFLCCCDFYLRWRFCERWPFEHLRLCHQTQSLSFTNALCSACMHSTYTHALLLNSVCFPSLSPNLPMFFWFFFFICWAFRLTAFIYCISKPIIIKEKQRDNKGKSSTSVGISEKIWSLSQWKSCCKIMLISFWEKRAAWAKKKKKERKCISFFLFKRRWNTRGIQMEKFLLQLE